MGATKAADFAFVPKVWQDHITAYFDRKMVVGQFALRDNTLTAAPGETVNFPYFKKIGAAEEPDEDSGLSVDKLQDDSFSCTVKEVAKAVGVKKRALRKSAAQQDKIFGETQSQIAQVHAEKVDADLLTEMDTNGNYVTGFTATDSTLHKATVNNILNMKISAFGDKHNQAVAIFMHSFCFLDMLSDSAAGFLKADSTMPYFNLQGYEGKLLGMDVFTLDTMPLVTAVSSKKTYASFIIKQAPYGIIMAESPEMEQDYDMLHREYVFAACQYYGVKALHAKVSADDKRIARGTFVTSQTA